MRRIKLLSDYENVFIFWWETIKLFLNFAALSITLGSSSYTNVKFKRTHLIQVVFGLPHQIRQYYYQQNPISTSNANFRNLFSFGSLNRSTLK